MPANWEDTIVALATASGAAGLAVVRLSGARAIPIAAHLFRGADLTSSESHRAHHGYVVDPAGERLDEVLALVMRAPHGYTGEDTVEFSCHGSPQVIDELVEAALVAGARLAEPGEFTRRAFMNGKLDLCQAEAVADLIDARSRAARRAALGQLQGRLSERLRHVREDLVVLLADIEASIDFVEEGLEFFAREESLRRADAARARVDALLATSGDGILLRSGVCVSFAGAPNVGKSSLFNRILRSPRSIVTQHAGTTRDVVRETVRIGGVPMVLEDTAGLRDGRVDPAEAIGIERSHESHRNADVVLHVVDVTSRSMPREKDQLLRSSEERTVVAVLNKCDLLPANEREAAFGANGGATAILARLGFEVGEDVNAIAVSAATGLGVDDLVDALLNTVKRRRLALQNDALVTINQRHKDALVRARAALEGFTANVRTHEPAEILAADLHDAVAALAEISGERIREEILDAVFSRFCIGK